MQLVLATIALTIPAVLKFRLMSHKRIILGLEPVVITMPSLAQVFTMTISSSRTNVQLGDAHVLLFFACLLLIFQRRNECRCAGQAYLDLSLHGMYVCQRTVRSRKKEFNHPEWSRSRFIKRDGLLEFSVAMRIKIDATGIFLEPDIYTEVYQMNTIQKLAVNVATATMVLSLAACSGMSAQDKNTAVGAGVGAVGGSILTGGSAVGTVGGAAVGGVIGHEINK